MTQTTSHYPQTDLNNLNLVSWRIQKTRSETRQNDVHRQLLERLHKSN